MIVRFPFIEDRIGRVEDADDDDDDDAGGVRWKKIENSFTETMKMKLTQFSRGSQASTNMPKHSSTRVIPPQQVFISSILLRRLLLCLC